MSNARMDFDIRRGAVPKVFRIRTGGTVKWVLAGVATFSRRRDALRFQRRRWDYNCGQMATEYWRNSSLDIYAKHGVKKSCEPS